jgi:hypothetical protein
MAVSERPPGADAVEIILQRAALGEVEKAELVEEAGLATDDLREAIDWLEEQGQLVVTDTGYRSAGGDDEPTGPEAAHPSEDEPLEPVPEQEAPGPAMTAHVRSHFEVVCSFGRSPGESDGAAVKKAQAIANEIGNALSAAMPRLDFHVEVSGVDAFDSPRSLWPPEDEEPRG